MVNFAEFLGNPEYNIPSVEPIVIDDLIKDTSGPLKLETTQVVAYGGGNYEIIDIMYVSLQPKFILI